MKRLVSAVILVVMIMSLVACKSGDKTVKDEGYEKFSKVTIGMTESEVEEILGAPTKEETAYKYYTIVVNGVDAEVQVIYPVDTQKATSISSDLYQSEYRDIFADKKTDLSKAKRIENGEITTYDECVSTFKTSGYVISIDEDGSKRCVWVNDKKGYMMVNFDSEGNVEDYNGYC